MTLAEFFGFIVLRSGMLFVITSMLAMALSTAQHNGSAAIVVAAQNFSASNTLPFVPVAAMLLLLVLLLTARRIGARSQASIPKSPNLVQVIRGGRRSGK